MSGNTRRILILNLGSGYGGAEESILHVTHYLNKMGYEVNFLYEHDKLGVKLSTIENDNLSVLRLKTGSMRKLCNLVKINYFAGLLYKKVRLAGIVISNSYRSTLLLAWLRLFYPNFDAKVYVYIRDFQQPLLRFILKLVQPDLVIMPTEAVKERSMYLGHYKNTVLSDLFLTNDGPADKYSSTVFYKYRIGCVANVKRWKGIDKAVDVLGILRRTYGLDVSLDIYGEIVDKQYYREISDKISRYGLQEYVKWNGFVDCREDIYGRDDIYLISSLNRFGGPETFSVVIAESWLFGKVPMAFNYGGPKYLVKDGYNGFLVRENPEEMAAKVAYLYEDFSRYEHFAKNGRASYKKLKADTEVNIMKIFTL